MSQAFAEFRRSHHWLEHVALYNVLHEIRGSAWTDWPVEERKPTATHLRELVELHAGAVAEASFFQFLAHSQLSRLKDYANRQGVTLIGDLPIYVDLDSVDVWLDPDLFDLDENCQPQCVSGVPPDAFTARGQLWNHPIYRWNMHHRQDYQWWIRRLGRCFEQTDIVRIDHFRGFAAYWSVPAGAADAVGGRWVDGPGLPLFKALERGLGGSLKVIAEDLGYIDEAVRNLKRDTGLPGMCVLAFGFGGASEGEGDSVHQPEHHPQHAVVYTGTHDNETVVQWRRNAPAADLVRLSRYFVHEGLSDQDFAWGFIELAFSSRAQLAVVPLQDFLALDERGRMNTPATEGGNWVWRAKVGDLSMDLAAAIRSRIQSSGRLPWS
jgi:4-alpha-glucanotransferase